MHKAINIKHRVVRRVDIEIAPLATFDTIDLGDEDEPIKKPLSEDDLHQEAKDHLSIPVEVVLAQCHTYFSCKVGAAEHVPANKSVTQTRTIGGNTSKKSLTQAGGDKNQDTGGLSSDVPAATSQHGDSKAEIHPGQSSVHPPEQLLSLSCTETQTATAICEGQARRVAYDRQGSLGRVSLPVRQPDSPSSSSSSSPESRSENTFTFQTLKPETSHLQLTCSSSEINESEEKYDSLVPNILEVTDPSEILSPSKRKAYERRIERLKVTTSPIARPRSTTPINVVSLDEYAAISSPDASPASPSVLQDKLKITLPADEFTAKPKTPKHQSGKRRNSEDTVFHFNEDTLFSRSKSALLVEKDGNLPLSPRRVLLPPTLTPTSSPKLSASPRLTKPVGAESIPPTISFSQQKATTYKFFGETVDELEEENWACFPEPSPTIEAPPSVPIPGLSTKNFSTATAGDPESFAHEELYQNISNITTQNWNDPKHKSADLPSQPLATLSSKEQTSSSAQPFFFEPGVNKEKDAENVVETVSSESDLKLQAPELLGSAHSNICTPDACYEASFYQNQADINVHDKGNQLTTSSQKISIDSQADLGQPNLCFNYDLKEGENSNLLSDQTVKTSVQTDSKESSNSFTPLAATGDLVNQHELPEENPLNDLIRNQTFVETSTVNNSQMSSLDDNSQAFPVANEKQLPTHCNTNPFLTTSIIQSNTNILVESEYKYTCRPNLEDSDIQGFGLDESQPQNTLLENNTVPGKVSEVSQSQLTGKQDNQQHQSSLQPQGDWLQNFQPQPAVPTSSQPKIEVEGDLIPLHKISRPLQNLPQSSQQEGLYPLQALIPESGDSQLLHFEQTSSQQDGDQRVEPSAHSTDAIQAASLPSCQENGPRSEIEGTGYLEDPSTAAPVNLCHPTLPDSLPGASQCLDSSNPLLSGVGASPASLSSHKPEETENTTDCVIESPAVMSSDDLSTECLDVLDKQAA